MALYAVDDDDLIYAGHAEAGKTYWCLDCFGPVKRRKGKTWIPHFYHLKPSPSCRLYSKTEDHLLAQLHLQKEFPEGTLQIERPFTKISRIADVCWEKEKIVFEIQCSPISERELEARIHDYGSVGYGVVWLLDDRRYNKRIAKPAEEFARRHATYFISIKRGLSTICYDQFEIFAEQKRVKRGKRMPIDLQKIRRLGHVHFDKDLFPKQVIDLQVSFSFQGDRMYRALQNHRLAMQNWRALEILLTKKTRKPKKWLVWLHRHIIHPYKLLIWKLAKEL
jgi:competence protein CoiA